MLIYNITTKVDHEILNNWMQWQREIHIPEMIATGCFFDHRFYELLEHEEEDGKTFVIQFFSNTRSDYEKYITEFAPALRKKSSDKWNGHAITFRTLLQNVQ
jgi:hypothetical protein